MAIAEDGSAPAVATATGIGPITTASFSPPANTLLVALVAGGYGNSPNAPTAVITDSVGGTWTKRPEAVNSGAPSFYGGVSIWYRYIAAAPGSMSVTSTYTNLSGGKLLQVLVLTGAKPDQTGSGQATNAINTATTAWTASITTTVTASRVYGICDDPVTNDTLTAAANTSLIGSFYNDTTDQISAAVGKATAATGTPGATTLGFTNAASQTGVVALLEILPVTTTNFTQTPIDSAGLTDTTERILSHAVTWVTGAFRVRTSKLRGGNTLRGSSGASYTQSPIDSAGLTDTEGTTEAPAPTDSAGLTDVVLKTVSQATVDSSGLTDNGGITEGQGPVDSAGLTDVYTVTPVKAVTQVDSSGLTDTEGTALSSTTADSTGLTDTVLKSIEQGAVDSAGLTDTSVVEKVVLVTQIDSAGLTDTEGTALSSVTADSVGLTDTQALIRTLAPVDSAGLTDTSLVESGRLLSQIDSSGLTDVSAAARTMAIADSSGLTDTTATVEGEIRSDSAGLTDVAQVGLERTASSVDSAGLTDVSTFARVITYEDSSGLTDTTPVARTVVFVDSAGLTDSATDAISMTPVDSAGLTDTKSLSVNFTKEDSTGLTDTNAGSRTLVFVDGTGLSDTTGTGVSYVIQDSAGLSDTYQTGSAALSPASLLPFWSSLHSYPTH